jgi:hypothetical protein
MNIENKILEIAKRFELREKALSSINDVIDASIEADLEQGIDFLDGQNRADLIYDFCRFEFHIDSNGNQMIATRINIYSKKLYRPNYDVPIGYYIELRGMNGEHIDEFLKFDWSPISLNISYYIERINKTIPKIYLRRNKPEYEFATYINHAVSLFQGRDYDGAVLFIKRCLDYIDKNGRDRLDKEYLEVCLGFLKDTFHFIVNEKLVNTDKIDKYKIKERIITKS